MGSAEPTITRTA